MTDTTNIKRATLSLAELELRDYFAAKAMQGFITNLDPGEERLLDVQQLAKSAYNIADAMLKAREASK